MASSGSFFAKGFLDGFGPGSFFFPARLPGMPERVFAEATEEDLAWVEERKLKSNEPQAPHAQTPALSEEIIATVVELRSAR